MVSSTTDSELVRASIDGDDSAFAQLLERYLKPVYRYVFRFARSAEESEDITQETFVKVWKNLKKYNARESFRAWIFTIAHRTLIDHMRKKKTLPFSTFDSDEGNAVTDTLRDDALIADEVFARAEDQALLEGKIAELPLDYRDVLVLHYQEEMTFDEIGTVLHKPLNTVKSQHRRALLMLKKKLI